MKGNNKGFTLIELIVVITILGILAAVALPRFVSLQADARAASARAALGAMQAAAALAHGANLARSQLAAEAAVVEGGTVTMCNRYPTADTAGIIFAAGITATDYNIDATGTGVGGQVTVRPNGIPDTNNTCVVTYTAATGADCTSPGAAPTFAIAVTDCN